MSAKHTLYSIQANQRSAEHAEQADKLIQQACTFADLARQTECIEEIIQARDDAQRSEKDLEAQRGMASWAMYTVIISGWLLLATATGVWYVRDTLVQTRRAVEETARATEATVNAVEVARQSAERELRAYVAVREAVLTEVDADKSLSLRYQIQNFGQTPAYRLWYFARPFIAASNLRADEIIDALTLRGPPAGQTLDPSAGITIRYSMSFSDQRLEKLRFGDESLYVIGFVRYVDCFDRVRDSMFSFFLTGDGFKKGSHLSVCAGGNTST